jgi:site-specific DNA-methyltransferase (adenine-specific)
MPDFQIINGDALQSLQAMPEASVDCCVTSPPYWGQRDYGHEGQVGLEPSPEAYVAGIVAVFREVRRVLKPEGTLWLNLGDSYATGTTAPRKQSTNPGVGSNRPEAQNSVPRCGTPKGMKTKDLIGIPWMVAFALRSDGWYLRQDIIWQKPNTTPESVTDRCTKAHEYLFLMAKSPRYQFDGVAIREDAVDGTKRNRRDVWSIPTKGFPGAHFAVMPEALVEPCILAGCPKGGTVLDPFTGSGTVGVVAMKNGRNFLGIELNPEYCEMAGNRIRNAVPPQSLFNPSALGG